MITKISREEVLLRVFFDAPEKKFHLRGLSRNTGLSIAGVIKIVKRLEASGVLKSKIDRTVRLVEADFDGNFLFAKKASNLARIYESGLVDELKSFYEQPRCIVLFGSYAEGTDISTSDLDIAIITKLSEVPDLSKFEDVLKRHINVINVDLSSVKASFKNSLANGIVLFGFLELVK